jgi:hypothetical protein
MIASCRLVMGWVEDGAVSAPPERLGKFAFQIPTRQADIAQVAMIEGYEGASLADPGAPESDEAANRRHQTNPVDAGAGRNFDSLKVCQRTLDDGSHRKNSKAFVLTRNWAFTRSMTKDTLSGFA